jgi:hypothetical protein
MKKIIKKEPKWVKAYPHLDIPENEKKILYDRHAKELKGSGYEKYMSSYYIPTDSVNLPKFEQKEIEYLDDSKLCGCFEPCFICGDARWGHFGGVMCYDLIENKDGCFSFKCDNDDKFVNAYFNKIEYDEIKENEIH